MKSLFAALAALAFVSTASAQSLSQPGVAGNGNTVICQTFNSTASYNGTPLGTTVSCGSYPDQTIADLTAWSITQCPQIDTNSKDGNGAEVFRACTPLEARRWLWGNAVQGILANVVTWKKQAAFAAAEAPIAVAPPTPAN